MKFILASNNAKKLVEMKAILSELGAEVLSQSEAGCDFEVDETGTTFAENAFLKANAAMKATGFPAIADDSGLVVDALGGQPGVYSARYGGSSCRDDRERNLLLLKNMDNIEDRRAKFVSHIACVFPDGSVIDAEGECAGLIRRDFRGDGGFGYDPLFDIPELGMTMAELTLEVKNKVSHRAKALEIFKGKLKEKLQEKNYADK